MGFVVRQDKAINADVYSFNSADQLYVNEEIVVSNVYPNPANDYIRISYNMPSTHQAKLVFLNILGTRMGEHPLPSERKEVFISTEELASGIYFHTLYINGKSMATKKLIIKH